MENNQENSTRSAFFIGLGALIAAVIAFGLAFLPPLGVYSLIASVLLELASLSFLNAQKKRNFFKAVKYVTVFAYAMLAASVALFAGGLIFSAVNK